jgi:hypothetical protein
MRVLLAALLTSITFAFPSVSHANIIEITFFEDFFVFGTTDASLRGPEFDTIRLNGKTVVSFEPFGNDFNGKVQLTTGRLEGLVVDDILSRYEYGPGEIVILANWEDLEGNNAHGRFTGVLLGMTIELCEQQLATDEQDCADPFGESKGEAMASLGAGRFEPAFARALGIGRHTSGGEFFLPIDGVTGNPLSAIRFAGAAEGTGTVEIQGVVVPEPAITSLLAVFVLSTVGYRRLRTR